MTRALVLSGGGPVGIAWEAGLIAGLAEGGAHLAKADYILGTSAGSFVGSQLAMGKAAGDMAAAILAEANRPRPAPRLSRPSATGPFPGSATHRHTRDKSPALFQNSTPRPRYVPGPVRRCRGCNAPT